MPKNKTIEREYLRKTYFEYSNVKAARILKISATTMNKLLVQAGIELKGRGQGRRNKITVI